MQLPKDETVKHSSWKVSAIKTAIRNTYQFRYMLLLPHTQFNIAAKQLCKQLSLFLLLTDVFRYNLIITCNGI